MLGQLPDEPQGGPPVSTRVLGTCHQASLFHVDSGDEIHACTVSVLLTKLSPQVCMLIFLCPFSSNAVVFSSASAGKGIAL